MLAKEMNALFNSVVALQLIKNTKYEFRFFLIEVKKKIKPLIEVYIEKQDALREEGQALLLQYCEYDEDDKAVIDEDGNYKGLFLGQQPEYDTRTKELNKAMKDLQKEEIGIDFDDLTIKKVHLPKKEMTGLQQEAIQQFIED